MGADEFAPKQCSSTYVRGDKTFKCGLIEGHGAEQSSETSAPTRWASAPKIGVGPHCKTCGESLPLGDCGDSPNVWFDPCPKCVPINEMGKGVADSIAHPPHYTQFPVEVIQITEHLNFCRGNVVKYVCRAGAKEGEDEVTPLRKAHWYLERELDRLDPEWRKR